MASRSAGTAACRTERSGHRNSPPVDTDGLFRGPRKRELGLVDSRGALRVSTQGAVGERGVVTARAAPPVVALTERAECAVSRTDRVRLRVRAPIRRRTAVIAATAVGGCHARQAQ